MIDKFWKRTIYGTDVYDFIYTDQDVLS